MKTLHNIYSTATMVGVLALGLFGGGCSNMSSTTQRAGITALGATGAGALAYGITRDPVKTGIATAVGATVTQIAEGEDPAVRQAGFDEGYMHGQSDAIKREYFLRKSNEAQPAADTEQQSGQTVYYVVPGPTTTWDGRKLEPHQVAVRVVE